MKNILKYGFTACLALAFVFSGCSKDDDNDDNNSNDSEESSTSIVGTWKLTTEEYWEHNGTTLSREIIDGVEYDRESGEKDKVRTYVEEYYEFTADGKFIGTFYSGKNQAKEKREVYNATYTVDGNQLKLIGEDGEVNSIASFKITGKTLVLEFKVWVDHSSETEYYVETPNCNYYYTKTTLERQ